MIKYVGVNDKITELFEGQFIVPNGISYNSYLLLEDKTCLFDTVDIRFYNEFLENVKNALNGKKLDYLVINHMEPDHSASIDKLLNLYPDVTVVSTQKSFQMINQFFPVLKIKNQLVVKDGDNLNLGNKNITFVTAPMVHWPEVMFSYLVEDKILFSADAFGKFGSLDYDDPEGWACEARRYYFGIVGKYGQQVQAVLKKLANFNIEAIYPLHGPVLDSNLSYYLNLYDIWSKYEPENDDATTIVYSSVYGNTREAALYLASKLKKDYDLFDLVNDDMAEAVEGAFENKRLVICTITYNGEVFPQTLKFLNALTERNYQNRKIAIIENGSWAPNAKAYIYKHFEKSKNIEFYPNVVSIKSKMSDENIKQIDELAKELED